mgnify:CR=1 FL=1
MLARIYLTATVKRSARNEFYQIDKAFTSQYSYIMMIPGAKGLNPHELAHRWVKDFGTRPDMSIKVGW